MKETNVNLDRRNVAFFGFFLQKNIAKIFMSRIISYWNLIRNLFLLRYGTPHVATLFF